MRTLTPTVLLFSLVLVPFRASAQSHPGGLVARVAELEAQMEELTAALAQAQAILRFVRVKTGEMQSLVGPHWIIEGANVHVRSGSGRTDDGCVDTDLNFPNCENLTGLGNFVVGYNENPRGFDNRSGSHNLVVGPEHTYGSFGGLVAGRDNLVDGQNSSVSGGLGNAATGGFSSVSGGVGNRSIGINSSVSGGVANVASGRASSVSGGWNNEAGSPSGPGSPIGRLSSVSGGEGNVATGAFSSVSGGQGNEASGTGASVIGGRLNVASGVCASITGGEANEATGGQEGATDCLAAGGSISGGAHNVASATASSVTGGKFNVASGGCASVSGGQSNEAAGQDLVNQFRGICLEGPTSVSGGQNRTAPNEFNWAAGSLLEEN